MNSTPRTAVLILGMHRSGTSCLAGSLQQRGLHLGQVHEWNPHNLKGNRESQRIMELNDAVLRHNGGSWDVAPQGCLSWDSSHAAERDDIVRELQNGDGAMWGFKDPRSLLTLDFWRQGLGKTLFVGTFRHPAMVAQSLHARSRMSFEQALELWCVYNQRLLDLHALASFPLLPFDLPPERYLLEVDRLADAFGLPAATGTVVDNRFFDRSLRKSDGEGIEVSADARALHARLLIASSRING